MDNRDAELVLGALVSRGPVTSAELQALTGRSQPTVSRILGSLSDRVLVLGRARSTRYGLAQSIRGLPAQLPIHWTDEAGRSARIGTVSLLVPDWVAVEVGRHASVARSAVPWFLTPVQAHGFLGRLLARRLAASGLDPDPERWSVDAVLYAAAHLHDAPGAVTIGEPVESGPVAAIPGTGRAAADALDALATDVARTLPAGSSAGGEQPKFLAVVRGAGGADAADQHVLVKFTPPRGTPFGERWHDLLHAERMACDVLAEHGVAVAQGTVVESATRTFLSSRRFDRLGARGRRHVVSIGAVHRAFVPGPWQHWAATCERLAHQRRLPSIDAERARALLQFGRLIGNTDMHSGNLGLYVERSGLERGRFALAPVYDMLPMRWRPDAVLGGAPEYAPFEPDAASLAGPALGPALEFWRRLASHAPVGAGLRDVASEMARRIVAAAR